MNICRVFVRNMSQGKKWEALHKVGIIGVPFEKGQKKYGVSVAPAALRSAGLIEQLQEIEGLDVKDFGDIETPGIEEVKVDNMAHLALVSACNKKLSHRVSQVLTDDRVVVTIGGDHSIGVGTVDGHYKVNEDMILIWVDAHADINTNKTSGSGSVHGMPVALLVKEFSNYWPYLPTMDWQDPVFSIKSLGYIGLRSVDNYERLAIEKYKVPTFAMEDVEEHGIKKSIQHVLHTLDPTNSRPIHVSFDIDALDALEAPSTGTPVRGGLSLREAINLMEIVHATGRLRAVDLVEINPAVGNESDRKQTIEAGLCVLKAALGFSRRGTAPRGVLDLPLQDPKVITTVAVVNCLQPLIHNDINEEIKNIIAKYVNKIPDVKSSFIVSEPLSKVINHYFKGKITTFPLYKISLTIDRNPVKIPWTLDGAEVQKDYNEYKNVKQRRYKVYRPKTTRTVTTSEATTSEATTSEATTSEATTSEATTSRATTSKATSSEATTSKSTTSKVTTTPTTISAK